MLIVRKNQVAIFNSKLSDNYLIKIELRIKKGFPELYEKNGNKLIPNLKLLIEQSKSWKLTTNDAVVKYAYLILTYELSSIEKIDPQVSKLMSWPNRKEEDKLDYLHLYLIKKHNGIDPR